MAVFDRGVAAGALSSLPSGIKSVRPSEIMEAITRGGLPSPSKRYTRPSIKTQLPFRGWEDLQENIASTYVPPSGVPSVEFPGLLNSIGGVGKLGLALLTKPHSMSTASANELIDYFQYLRGGPMENSISRWWNNVGGFHWDQYYTFGNVLRDQNWIQPGPDGPDPWLLGIPGTRNLGIPFDGWKFEVNPSFAAALPGEIALDPWNWATLGLLGSAKSALLAGTRGAMQAMSRKVATEALEGSLKQALSVSAPAVSRASGYGAVMEAAQRKTLGVKVGEVADQLFDANVVGTNVAEFKQNVNKIVQGVKVKTGASEITLSPMSDDALETIWDLLDAEKAFIKGGQSGMNNRQLNAVARVAQKQGVGTNGLTKADYIAEQVARGVKGTPDELGRNWKPLIKEGRDLSTSKGMVRSSLGFRVPFTGHFGRPIINKVTRNWRVARNIPDMDQPLGITVFSSGAGLLGRGVDYGLRGIPMGFRKLVFGTGRKLRMDWGRKSLHTGFRALTQRAQEPFASRLAGQGYNLRQIIRSSENPWEVIAAKTALRSKSRSNMMVRRSNNQMTAIANRWMNRITQVQPRFIWDMSKEEKGIFIGRLLEGEDDARALVDKEFLTVIDSLFQDLANAAEQAAGKRFLPRRSFYMPHRLSEEASAAMGKRWESYTRRYNSSAVFSQSGAEIPRGYVAPSEYSSALDDFIRKQGTQPQTLTPEGRAQFRAQYDMTRSPRSAEFMGHPFHEPNTPGYRGDQLQNAPAIPEQIADIMADLGISHELFNRNAFQVIPAYVNALAKRVGEVHHEHLLRNAGVLSARDGWVTALYIPSAAHAEQAHVLRDSIRAQQLMEQESIHSADVVNHGSPHEDGVTKLAHENQLEVTRAKGQVVEEEYEHLNQLNTLLADAQDVHILALEARVDLELVRNETLSRLEEIANFPLTPSGGVASAAEDIIARNVSPQQLRAALRESKEAMSRAELKRVTKLEQEYQQVMDEIARLEVGTADSWDNSIYKSNWTHAGNAVQAKVRLEEKLVLAFGDIATAKAFLGWYEEQFTKALDDWIIQNFAVDGVLDLEQVVAKFVAEGMDRTQATTMARAIAAKDLRTLTEHGFDAFGTAEGNIPRAIQQILDDPNLRFSTADGSVSIAARSGRLQLEEIARWLDEQSLGEWLAFDDPGRYMPAGIGQYGGAGRSLFSAIDHLDEIIGFHIGEMDSIAAKYLGLKGSNRLPRVIERYRAPTPEALADARKVVLDASGTSESAQALERLADQGSGYASVGAHILRRQLEQSATAKLDDAIRLHYGIYGKTPLISVPNEAALEDLVGEYRTALIQRSISLRVATGTNPATALRYTPANNLSEPIGFEVYSHLQQFNDAMKDAAVSRSNQRLRTMDPIEEILNEADNEIIYFNGGLDPAGHLGFDEDGILLDGSDSVPGLGVSAGFTTRRARIDTPPWTSREGGLFPGSGSTRTITSVRRLPNGRIYMVQQPNGTSEASVAHLYQLGSANALYRELGVNVPAYAVEHDSAGIPYLISSLGETGNYASGSAGSPTPPAPIGREIRGSDVVQSSRTDLATQETLADMVDQHLPIQFPRSEVRPISEYPHGRTAVVREGEAAPFVDTGAEAVLADPMVAFQDYGWYPTQVVQRLGDSEIVVLANGQVVVVKAGTDFPTEGAGTLGGRATEIPDAVARYSVDQQFVEGFIADAVLGDINPIGIANANLSITPWGALQRADQGGAFNWLEGDVSPWSFRNEAQDDIFQPWFSPDEITSMGGPSRPTPDVTPTTPGAQGVAPGNVGWEHLPDAELDGTERMIRSLSPGDRQSLLDDRMIRAEGRAAAPEDYAEWDDIDRALGVPEDDYMYFRAEQQLPGYEPQVEIAPSRGARVPEPSGEARYGTAAELDLGEALRAIRPRNQRGPEGWLPWGGIEDLSSETANLISLMNRLVTDYPRSPRAALLRDRIVEVVQTWGDIFEGNLQARFQEMGIWDMLPTSAQDYRAYISGTTTRAADESAGGISGITGLPRGVDEALRSAQGTVAYQDMPRGTEDLFNLPRATTELNLPRAEYDVPTQQQEAAEAALSAGEMFMYRVMDDTQRDLVGELQGVFDDAIGGLEANIGRSVPSGASRRGTAALPEPQRSREVRDAIPRVSDEMGQAAEAQTAVDDASEFLRRNPDWDRVDGMSTPAVARYFDEMLEATDDFDRVRAVGRELGISDADIEAYGRIAADEDGPIVMRATGSRLTPEQEEAIEVIIDATDELPDSRVAEQLGITDDELDDYVEVYMASARRREVLDSRPPRGPSYGDPREVPYDDPRVIAAMVEPAARYADPAEWLANVGREIEEGPAATEISAWVNRFSQLFDDADTIEDIGVAAGRGDPGDVGETIGEWMNDLRSLEDDLGEIISSERFTANATPEFSESMVRLHANIQTLRATGEESFEQTMAAARALEDAPGDIGSMLALGSDASAQWAREGYTVEPLVRHGSVIGWLENLKQFADEINDFPNANVLQMRMAALDNLAAHSTFSLNPARGPLGDIPLVPYRYMEDFANDYRNLTSDLNLGARPPSNVNMLWEGPVNGVSPYTLATEVQTTIGQGKVLFQTLLDAGNNDIHRAITDYPQMFQEQVGEFQAQVSSLATMIRGMYDRIAMFAPPRSAAGPTDVPVSFAETSGLFTDFLENLEQTLSPIVRVFEPEGGRISSQFRGEAAEIDALTNIRLERAAQVADIPDDAPLAGLSPDELRQAFTQSGIRPEDEIAAARERIRTQQPEPEPPSFQTSDIEHIELFDDLPPDVIGDYGVGPNNGGATIGYNNNLNRNIPDEFKTPDRREAPMGPMGQWIDQAYIENLVSGGIVEQPRNLSMFFPDPNINRGRLMQQWARDGGTQENFPKPFRLEEVYDAQTGQFDMPKIFDRFKDDDGGLNYLERRLSGGSGEGGVGNSLEWRTPKRTIQIANGYIDITGRPLVWFTGDDARPWMEFGSSGRRGIELHWNHDPLSDPSVAAAEMNSMGRYLKDQLMPQLDAENIELSTFVPGIDWNAASRNDLYAKRKLVYEGGGVRFFDTSLLGRTPGRSAPAARRVSGQKDGFPTLFVPPRVHLPRNKHHQVLNPLSTPSRAPLDPRRGLANREIPEIGGAAYEHLQIIGAIDRQAYRGFRVPARKPPGLLATGATVDRQGKEIPIWLREVADVLDFKPDDHYAQALVAWNARTEPAVAYGLMEQQVDNLLAVRARYGSFETFLLEQNGLTNPSLEQMANVESMAAFLEYRAKRLAEVFNLSFFPKNSDDLLRSQAARFGMGQRTIEGMDRRQLVELLRVTPENGGFDGGQGIAGTVEDAFPHEGALPGQRVRYQLSSGAYDDFLPPDFEDFQAVWSADGLGPIAAMNSRVALDLSNRGSVRMYGTSPWQREAVRQEVLGMGSAARDPWEMESLGRMYGTPPTTPGQEAAEGFNIQPHTFGQLADRRIRDDSVLGDGNPFRGEGETDVLLRQRADGLKTIVAAIAQREVGRNTSAEYWSLAIRLAESPKYRHLFAQGSDSSAETLQSALDFVFWRIGSDWATGVTPIGQTAGRQRVRWHPPAVNDAPMIGGGGDPYRVRARADYLQGRQHAYVSRGQGPGTFPVAGSTPTSGGARRARVSMPLASRRDFTEQEDLYGLTGLGRMWDNMGLWEHTRAPGRTRSTVDLEDITPRQSDNLVEEILRFQAAMDPALNPFAWALNVREVRTKVGNSASTILRSMPEKELAQAFKVYRLALAGDGYNAVAWPNTSRVPIRGTTARQGAPDPGMNVQGETPVMAEYPAQAADREAGELAQPPFRAPIDTDTISPGAFNRFNVDIVPTNPAALVALKGTGEEALDPASYVKWFEDKAVRAMMDTPPLRDGPPPDALQAAVEAEQTALSNFEMLDRAWGAQMDSLAVLEIDLATSEGELEVLQQVINYGKVRLERVNKAKAQVERIRESRLRLGENMDPGTVDIDRWVAEQDSLIEDLRMAVLLLGQKDLEEFQGLLSLMDSEGYRNAREAMAGSQKVLGMKQSLPFVEAVIDRGFRSGYKPIGVDSSGPEGFVEALGTAYGYDQRGRANAFTKYYDKAHNVTKGYMIFSPGFFFRNYYGGMFMNYLANVSPVRYAQFIKANKVIQLENKMGIKGAEATSRELKKLERKQGRVPQEHLDYVRQLEQAGAFGPGQTGIEFEPALSSVGSTIRVRGQEYNLQSLNLFSSEFIALRGARNVNMKVETLLRGTIGFDRLANGRSLDDAIDDIVKFHFDYDDLSAFERGVVKRVTPFYTWTRRAIPLLVEQYGKRPQVFHNYVRSMRAIEADESEQVPGSVYPRWLMRQGGVPINLKFGGENMFLAPDLPPRSFLDMVNPMTRGGMSLEDRGREAARAGTGMLTPFIKAPVELYMKRNLWKGYHFNGTIEWVPPVMTGIPGLMKVLEQTGYAKQNEKGHWGMRDYQLHAFFQMLPLMGTARRLSGVEERYSERWLSTWVSFLFGVGLRTNTEYEQQMERRGRLYRERDERIEKRQLEGIRPDG